MGGTTMALDNNGREIIFQDLESYSVDEKGNSCMNCKYYFTPKTFPGGKPCVSCSRCDKWESYGGEVRFDEIPPYPGPEIKINDSDPRTSWAESGGTLAKPGTIIPVDDVTIPYVEPPKTQHFVDPVKNPPHYTSHPSGVECITITEHMCFNLGNAMKYIWRSDLKWDRTEDIKKAIWYLQRELKRERKVNDAKPTTEHNANSC